MQYRPELLVADFDQGMRGLCACIANEINHPIAFATDSQRILRLTASGSVGVVLLDARTVPECIDLVRELKKQSARIEVLIVAETASIPNAVAAIKAGTSDYLEKPCTEASLKNALSIAFTNYGDFQASVVPMQELERQAIEYALAQAAGNKIEAARLLSIGKTTLYRKLREYNGQHEMASGHTGTA